MTDIDIGFGWNAFQTCAVEACKTVSITENGVVGWNDPNIIVSVFFYVAVQAYLNLTLIPQNVEREAELLVRIPQLDKNFTAQFLANNSNPVLVGGLNITTPGYIRVDISGTPSLVNKKIGSFPALKQLRLSGISDQSKINYVQNSFSSHFGRRGPSVHLWYKTSGVGDIQQFYNDVSVPKTQDKVGTYAMAIGFDFGYFGMQVNSDTERRILFSVWSPQSTDDPKSVKPENKVILIEKGQNVTTNDFGGEGSGGQSYLVYPWVADVSYKFKLVGQPSTDGYSIFSAYFQDPTKSNDFMLIATWKRPKAQSYLTGIYSFLENFRPENGHITRKVNYNNQSAVNKEGKSYPITQASFSFDSTASQKQRLDYDGGVEANKGYYLKNCGFFQPTNVQYGTVFQRTANVTVSAY